MITYHVFLKMNKRYSVKWTCKSSLKLNIDNVCLLVIFPYLQLVIVQMLIQFLVNHTLREEIFVEINFANGKVKISNFRGIYFSYHGKSFFLFTKEKSSNLLKMFNFVFCVKYRKHACLPWQQWKRSFLILCFLFRLKLHLRMLRMRGSSHNNYKNEEQLNKNIRKMKLASRSGHVVLLSTNSGNFVSIFFFAIN